jgi:hypothetical protein
MIRSPVLRAAVALAALGTAAVLLMGWNGASTLQRIVAGLVAGFAVMLAAGMLAPARHRRGAMRVVAGLACAACLAYAIVEVVALLGGQAQPIRVGEPSAVMSLLLLLLAAIPLGIFAVSGRTMREWRQAEAHEEWVAREPEEYFIAHLEHDGWDLSRPIAVRFAARVPTEAHARSLARVAEQHGLPSEIVSRDDGEIRVRITRELVLTHDALRAASGQMRDLARRFGGELVQWSVSREDMPRPPGQDARREPSE